MKVGCVLVDRSGLGIGSSVGTPHCFSLWGLAALSEHLIGSPKQGSRSQLAGPAQVEKYQPAVGSPELRVGIALAELSQASHYLQESAVSSTKHHQ